MPGKPEGYSHATTGSKRQRSTATGSMNGTSWTTTSSFTSSHTSSHTSRCSCQDGRRTPTRSSARTWWKSTRPPPRVPNRSRENGDPWLTGDGTRASEDVYSSLQSGANHSMLGCCDPGSVRLMHVRRILWCLDRLELFGCWDRSFAGAWDHHPSTDRAWIKSAGLIDGVGRPIIPTRLCSDLDTVSPQKQPTEHSERRPQPVPRHWGPTPHAGCALPCSHSKSAMAG